MILDAVIDEIMSLEGFPCINVNLIGGEVTILKDFLEIIERIVSCPFRGNIRINITTNFSAPAEVYMSLIDIIKKYDRRDARRMLSMSISFYRDYTETETFEGKLLQVYNHSRGKTTNSEAEKPKAAGKSRKSGLQKAARKRMSGKVWAKRLYRRFIKQKTETVSLSTGYPILDDKDYADYLSMEKYFEDTNVKVAPILIRAYKTSVSEKIMKELLSDEMKNRNLKLTRTDGKTLYFRNIQAVGKALDDGKRFCPKGYICDAGMRNISINATGDVYRCPAIGNKMIMGNILDSGVSLLEKPEICTSGHCSCNQYTVIEKAD